MLTSVIRSLGVLLVAAFGVALASAQTSGDENSDQDRVVRLQSTVSGSQEQPRVMYIVPWQEPGAAEFDYTLDNRLVQDVFAPIDRDEFVRQLTYRDKIRSGADAADNEITH